MPLFQTSVLNKYLGQQDGVRMAAYEAFKLNSMIKSNDDYFECN